ncbi:M48 family metalloprotease [bacterium]|nr:M48 family metalloprotease [bacterium]
MMFRILVIFFATIFICSFHTEDASHSFVEETIVETDNINEFRSNITENQFYEIINLAQTTYDRLLEEKGLKRLKISGNWKSKTINAYMKGQLQVNLVDISGGLARRPEVSPEGFALVLCHEIGHAYGGKPDKRAPLFKASVEGQADFYGAGVCLKKIIGQIPESSTVKLTSYMKEACSKDKDVKTCERVLQAGQSAGNLLSFIKDQVEPNYTTPDESKVRRTLKSYPETVQCRLDTYFNGALGLKRPRCWYKR